MGVGASTGYGTSPARTYGSTTRKGQLLTIPLVLKLVVDFIAAWCGPCQYIQPAVNEFAETYTDVDFIKIDVDELDDVAQEFGVQTMPTFVLMKRGKEVDKVVGAKKEDLRKKIDKHRI
ncbi:hypothetical protein SASPL_130866 [Salvia splendens]|uniref:Thioredoxin domain-containing protein n=1 Tax=Salvia splendens TaxID=180675 RepID=A0A8X8X9W0_SALSN|nr:hypothetical protein SASPL_130866 [Salvia splendens]